LIPRQRTQGRSSGICLSDRPMALDGRLYGIDEYACHIQPCISTLSCHDHFSFPSEAILIQVNTVISERWLKSDLYLCP
jgi:hypothetical protein